jgi:kynurenine formamidase
MEITTPRRWIRRPEGSNWGDFGDEDQIGRLNLVTPERRLAAIAEVRDGIAFSLSLPLHLPGQGVQPPSRHPPILSWPAGQNTRLADLFDRPGVVDIGNDDEVLLSLQYSTQWDALAHVGALFDADGDGIDEPVFYNGFRGQFNETGITKLGIDAMATSCVQGRGVLVNLLKAFGNRKIAVGYEALMAVFEAQRIEVEPGDMLCLYTGFADAVLDMGVRCDAAWLSDHFTGLDGADHRLQQWITDSGISVIAADNFAVELPEDPTPAHYHGIKDQSFLPLHNLCLFKLGIHLGELFYFKDLAEHLARNERSRFLLTAPPLRLAGAVGSPAMPVGTV